jgi:hypothetical protein
LASVAAFCLHGLRVAGIALVLLSLVSTANRAQSPQPSAGQGSKAHPQPQQTKQGTAPNQQGTEQAPLIVRVQPTQKTQAEAAEEEKERRDKAELDRKVADFSGKLADYTMYLAIVAVLQFFALLFQAFFLGGTLRATREALVTTERAFVFLDDFEPDWTLQHPTVGSPPRLRRFIAKPRWRNSGTTPTRNMTITVNWSHWQGEMPTNFSFAYGEGASMRMFLGPQASEWSAPIEIPANVATDALNGSTQIYIWGRVDYEDIFNATNPHFTQWCYRLNITRDASTGAVSTQFVAYGNYNNSDEDARRKRKR